MTVKVVVVFPKVPEGGHLERKWSVQLEEDLLRRDLPDTDDGVPFENQEDEAVAMVESPSCVRMKFNQIASNVSYLNYYDPNTPFFTSPRLMQDCQLTFRAWCRASGKRFPPFCYLLCSNLCRANTQLGMATGWVRVYHLHYIGTQPIAIPTPKKTIFIE